MGQHPLKSAIADDAPRTVASDALAALHSTALSEHHASAYERLVKPAIDKVIALTMLVVLSPLIVVVALLVKLSLGSPVLLRQKRVGRNGEVFELHKFRTMHADRRQDEDVVVVPFDGRDRRLTHKHPDDPRLTFVGRMLRKWSLDELPQLLDVLSGKLSIVGPRPELVKIVANYEPWQHARHAVKPGLTGLWQVTARGDGEMHEHVDLDIEYLNNVTFRNDIKIMLLTLPAVLKHKGY